MNGLYCFYGNGIYKGGCCFIFIVDNYSHAVFEENVKTFKGKEPQSFSPLPTTVVSLGLHFHIFCLFARFVMLSCVLLLCCVLLAVFCVV